MKKGFLILAILLYASFLSAQVSQVSLNDILEFKIDTTCQKLAGWFSAFSTGKMCTYVENDTLTTGKSVPSCFFTITYI